MCERGLTSWRFARNVYASSLAKNMTFPVYITLGSLKIHPHLVFEMLAYAVAFRVYLLLRKRRGDRLGDGDRWWMIAAAAMGAENPAKNDTHPVMNPHSGP